MAFPAATPPNGSPQSWQARPTRFSSNALNVLKERDNVSNFYHLAKVYLIIIAAIGGAIWCHNVIIAYDLGWGWHIPVALLAIAVAGASQHQLGGAVHEGTHYILFSERKLNELASDWLAAFPIYASTYQYRTQHFAHHQFVNDPERDPDLAQVKDSGHWLEFPITHVEMLWALLKQLWLPNLFRYTVARARYGAIGVPTNPYRDPNQKGSALPAIAGGIFMAGGPVIFSLLTLTGDWRIVAAGLLLLWGGVTIFMLVIPLSWFGGTRLQPVISHRMTSISRVTYAAIAYGSISALELAGYGPAWIYFGLYWIVPLFTTFPLFMVIRQWVQHGNADRGRYTNTRVFLAGPLLRYAVFPWGMDYHLPHHICASVPHYNLKKLHELLLTDSEYAENGAVLEGWLHNKTPDRPTILQALGPGYTVEGNRIHVDDDTLEHTEVNDRAAIAVQSAASRMG